MKNTSIVNLPQNEIFTVSGGISRSTIASSIIAGTGIIGSGLFNMKAKEHPGFIFGALLTTTLITVGTLGSYLIDYLHDGKASLEASFRKTVTRTALSGVIVAACNKFFHSKTVFAALTPKSAQ